MDNVLKFPKKKKGCPPQTLDEIRNQVDTVRKEHIEYLLDDVMSYVFLRSHEEGYDLSTEDNFSATALMIESFKAAIYKTKEMKHPLHLFSDSVMINEDSLEKISKNVDEKKDDD